MSEQARIEVWDDDVSFCVWLYCSAGELGLGSWHHDPKFLPPHSTRTKAQAKNLALAAALKLTEELASIAIKVLE